MARGIRTGTSDRVAMAREEHPLALGPWFGELATHYNISAAMVASIVGAHEQTVHRWFFGTSNMQPQWIKASIKLFAVLAWMHSANVPPLHGSVQEKNEELKRHMLAFIKLTKE